MNDTDLITQVLDRLSALLGVTVSLEALLFCIAVAAVSGFLITVLRKRRLVRLFSRQQQRIVFELLDSAVEQRSVLELEFNSAEMHGRKLTGPCSQVTSDALTVDVGLEYSLQSWTGEPVEVSFKLDYKGAATYYRFLSTVLAMHSGPRAVAIVLAPPAYIYPTQKRHYVRITPLPGHILGMGLWTLEPAGPLPLDSTGLGRAALSYRPGKTTQCSLLNLSAGGMRASIPQALLQQFPHGLQLQSKLLCLLLLRAPTGEQPMPFWLACTVVSLLEDYDDNSQIIVGLKFKAWALSETGSSSIFWFPSGQTGEVAPLAAWILRHQLEQNRLQT